MTHYADNLETSLVAEHTYTLKAPLELEGTPEEREAWTALERLQSINGTLLTAAEDAQDELEEAADAAQDAYHEARRRLLSKLPRQQLTPFLKHNAKRTPSMHLLMTLPTLLDATATTLST